uniref:Uncharacterized protein n=1 Tax=Trichuris muris TaxID=70415 RepID=A0A5S6QMU6_TRIMR
MRSITIIVAFLLAANSYSLRKPKEPLPDSLMIFIEQSKTEEKPTDSEAEITKPFLDKKLEEEEKALVWALQSTNVTKIEGNKLAGTLIVLFGATVKTCPSETQKHLSQNFRIAVKDPEENCKPEMMKREFPCSLVDGVNRIVLVDSRCTAYIIYAPCCHEFKKRLTCLRTISGDELLSPGVAAVKLEPCRGNAEAVNVIVFQPNTSVSTLCLAKAGYGSTDGTYGLIPLEVENVSESTPKNNALPANG